jgi:hypothetical protein
MVIFRNCFDYFAMIFKARSLCNLMKYILYNFQDFDSSRILMHLAF